jgi:hypothetical protein
MTTRQRCADAMAIVYMLPFLMDLQMHCVAPCGTDQRSLFETSTRKQIDESIISLTQE